MTQQHCSWTFSTPDGATRFAAWLNRHGDGHRITRVPADSWTVYWDGSINDLASYLEQRERALLDDVARLEKKRVDAAVTAPAHAPIVGLDTGGTVVDDDMPQETVARLSLTVYAGEFEMPVMAWVEAIARQLAATPTVAGVRVDACAVPPPLQRYRVTMERTAEIDVYARDMHQARLIAQSVPLDEDDWNSPNPAHATTIDPPRDLTQDYIEAAANFYDLPTRVRARLLAGGDGGAS